MTMTTYSRGDRVRLVHTNDVHTRLRPGIEGTVLRVTGDIIDGNTIVSVSWDDGSTLSMLIDEGDRIAPVVDVKQRGTYSPLDIALVVIACIALAILVYWGDTEPALPHCPHGRPAHMRCQP